MNKAYSIYLKYNFGVTFRSICIFAEYKFFFIVLEKYNKNHSHEMKTFVVSVAL